MKSGYAILGAIVVVGILLLSGCIGTNQNGFDMNKVIEAQKNIKQYAFEGEITAGKTGMQMNGKIDTENLKMYVNTNINGQNEESYIIGEEAYTKKNGQWSKMKKDVLWNNSNQYESTVEILKSPNTKIEVLGEENVDGDVCYIVNITADTEKLKEQFVKSMGGGKVGVEYTLNVSSYTLYVSKATNFIKKEYQNAYIVVSEQGINLGAEMTVMFKYKDINKPSEIQLPEEAKNVETTSQ
ncbi:hypothetical protein MSIBF_A2080009 [groundwater metagenome]|uniref:Lipoprotein n=1 Tax=groundwater metagenome TaxID=717931 RepID=A0A098EB66_9ZZZZ